LFILLAILIKNKNKNAPLSSEAWLIRRNKEKKGFSILIVHSFNFLLLFLLISIKKK